MSRSRVEAQLATGKPTRGELGAVEEAVVLVVPIVPQVGGNGLAMRAGMLLEALAAAFAVDVVVVPVSGPVTETEWAAGLARSFVVVEPVADSGLPAHLTRQLADPTLRERIARTAPQPWRALAAPATLATEAVTRLGPASLRPRALVALRGYLAPFGITLARALSAGRVVIDVDEDEERLARSMGADAEADAIGRLARVWLPDADVICAAAEHEGQDIAERYHCGPVRTLPNAVRVPAPIPSSPGGGRLLFVGNLLYEPNREAADLLAHAILPLVRASHHEASVTLVGAHGDRIARAPHVRLAGAVRDLRPFYREADVVVAPLLHGGGTRIKVLEAFAYRRPVVATSVAVAGLAVRDGVEVMLADSPGEFAAAVSALLEDPTSGVPLIESADRLLTARYTRDVLAPQVLDLVGAAGPGASSITTRPAPTPP